MNKNNTIQTTCCTKHGPAPIPQEGKWVQLKEITQICGLSHGVGGCAPRQGACKLTINVKDGIIVEALVEIIGCSGATQSACMAGEILCGKTLLEALNTDLVCDAINDAMKDVFQQLVYGRSQSAFSQGGLNEGACYEELGKFATSQVGTVYSSLKNGVRYLNTTEGFTTRLALDKNNEIIGYEYINVGKMLSLIQDGVDAKNAIEQSTKTYGRFDEGVKNINARK